MALTENSKASDFAHISASNKPAGDIPAGFAPNGATAQPRVDVQPTAAPQASSEMRQEVPYVTKPRGLLGGSRRQYSMPRYALGQIAIDFQEAFVKIAEKEPDLHYDGKMWKLQVFDGTQNRVAISGVIMVRDVPEYNTVAYYPIFLNKTAMELQDRQMSEPGKGQFNVPMIPEELWSTDTVLPQAVKNYISALYPSRQPLEVAALFVPTAVELDNRDQLRGILYYATEAIETTLYSMSPVDENISLANKADNEVISQSIRFSNDGQVADVVGLPLRNDIEVTLKVSARNAQTLNQGAITSEVLTMARGHIGLTYTGDPVYNPQMAYMYGQQPSGVTRAPYRASLILNSLDNQTSGATLETQLLALSSTVALVVNNGWAEALKPNYAITEEGADRRDIGALTLLVNKPGLPFGYTNTKTDSSFNLATYLMEFVSTDILYQLDVREVGELTHVQRVFMDMVPEINGKVEQNQEAYRLVVEAANRLTNGNFAKYWNNNDPIVFWDNNRIEVGYYVDDKGEYRDLAEVDFLYFGNRVQDGGAAAKEYMDSLNPQFGSIPYRFFKRLRLYQTYLPNFKITGFAQRLTINSAFLQALGQAIRDTVGSFQIENGNMNQTIESGYRNNLLGMTANQAVFFQQGYANNGYGYNGQVGGYGQRVIRPNQAYGFQTNMNYGVSVY